jgi:hypothetical protein
MTIFTIFGITAAIAAALTVVRLLAKNAGNIPINFIQNFVGVFFIFSGIVKAIDPAGTAIKMEEYFEIFNEYVPLLGFFWHFFAGHAMGFSFFMIVLEIVLGATMLMGVFKKTTLWLFLLITLFFTALTGFSHLTGKVTDCGCFGDFVKLEPKTSFYKDLVLLAMLLPLIIGQKHIREIFSKKIGYGLTILVLLLSTAFSYRNIAREPIVDFRAYKVGVNIPECLSLPPDAVPYKYELTFIYKNKETGVVEEFSGGRFPDDFSKWEFVDRKDVMVQKGDDPKCKDFAFFDSEGSDLTETYLSEDAYIFFIIAPNLEKASLKGFNKIVPIGQAAEQDGNYCVVLSGSPQSMSEPFRHENKIPFEFLNADATPLKTVMRSNPGVLLLKKGTIVAKWHFNELPGSYEEIKRDFFK